MSGRAETATAEWLANWPTVIACVIGISIPGIYIYSAGALIVLIEQETRWSRAGIGSGITIATFIAATIGPFMGAAVDRFGARRIALPGILAFCSAIAALSLAGAELWHWWLIWTAIGFAGFGIKPAIWTTAVAKVFEKSRGLALAVTLSGTGLGSMAVPIATTLLAERFGWRGAYIGLGVLWAAVCFPVALWGLRDGRRSTRAERIEAATTPLSKGELTLRKSLLTPQFLLMLIAITCFTTGAMAFVFTAIPILISKGFDNRIAAGIAALVGIASVTGRLVTGALLDRVNPKRITVSAMCLPVITATLLLALPPSAMVAWVAVLLMGLAFGAELDAIAYLTAHYFGTRNYGLLFGTLISGSTVATGLAPVISGRIYDLTQSYDGLLMLMIPLCLTAAGSIALLRPIKTVS